MDRRVILAVATTFSFVGVLGLYFYSCSIQAIPLQIRDIEMGDVGTIVRTSGHVLDQHLTAKGDLLLTLGDRENANTIVLYIPKDILASVEDKNAVLPGAQVEVTGEVQEYQGELEIVVSSADDIIILQYPKDSDLTIEILAQNPELFEGNEVTVSGQIQNLDAAYMWHQDEYVIATSFELRYSGEYGNYTMECLLVGNDVSGEFYQGQLVRFTGTFGYYNREAKWRIVSDEMTLHS